MRPSDRHVRDAAISWWATDASKPPSLDTLRARISAMWTSSNHGAVRTAVRPVGHVGGELRLVIELEDNDGMLFVYWSPLPGVRKHQLEDVVIG